MTRPTLKETVMDQTPIYTEALTEARRRTRKNSPERERIEAMNRRTDPARPVPNVEGAVITQGSWTRWEATR